MHICIGLVLTHIPRSSSCARRGRGQGRFNCPVLSWRGGWIRAARIWAAGAARVQRCVPVFLSFAARRVGHVSGWEGMWEGGWGWV
jgi:hypothetical protein